MERHMGLLELLKTNVKLVIAVLITASVAGYITKDKALLTNFGLQLPLFALGYYNYFLI